MVTKTKRKCTNIRNNKKLLNIHSIIYDEDEPIHIIQYGANNLTISFVINETYAKVLTKKLHVELIE